MRPHRLRITAFGAFGGTAEVDFDALAESGLFLLCGDTGAGKTTLLDAIGFALYGRVPGVRGQARRLRSDHADDATRTEVELEATLAGRHLRITRSPEQRRVKRRGSGTTTEPARVLLEERVGERWEIQRWETLSTRAGEADAEVADLLGMSAEQFFQVVLLPQGEFAHFLRADAAEKARLLERLFGTDRFRGVEARLADLRRRTQTQLEQCQEVIGRLVARISQVAGVPDPYAPVDAAWLDALHSTALTEHAAAAGQLVRAEQEREAAEDDARHAADLAERQQRLQAARCRHAKLAGEASAHHVLEAEHEAALRANGVRPALLVVTRLAQAGRDADAAEAASRQEVVQLGGPADDSAAVTYRVAGQRHHEQLGRLDALQATSLQAEQEHELASRSRRRDVELRAELDEAAARLAASATRREQLVLDKQLAVEAATALPQAQVAAARARGAADDASALAGVENDAQRLAATLVGLRERAVDLREHAADLRIARIDGMVVELAAHLEADTPCPVCGSTEHPDPTEQSLPTARVTPEAEKQAYQAADEAEARRSRHAERLAGSLARAAELRSRLSKDGAAPIDADPARLAEQAAGAAERVARLAALAESLAGMERRLAGIDSTMRGLMEAQAGLVVQRRAVQHEALEATRRAAASDEAVRAELGSAADLAGAAAAVRALAEACARAAGFVEAAAACRSDLGAARSQATRLALEAGFADSATAAAAERSLAWRDTVARRLRKYRDDLAAVQAVMQDPTLADLPTASPDLVSVLARQDAASQAWQSAVGTEAAAARTVDDLAVLSGQLKTALQAREPVALRHAEVRELADLAAGGGGNLLKMTLSSYVLAARLEEVAAGASERLLRMTQGRFSLVHTDTGRGNARAGLGLLARDTWTGVDRDTSTLSGGETFLASLALALGLADAVAAESGGTRLDALFIDEGFGSLDEQTLDEVMDVLDALREGGRMVGLVSHVAELRQRIPTQLHVRKGRHGSALAALAEAA